MKLRARGQVPVKRRIKKSKLFFSFIGFCVSFGFLFPYIAMFLIALKPKSDISDMPPTYLPKTWVWANFINVFHELPFAMYLRNTLIISLSTMVLGLLVSVPAGYYLARNNFRGRSAFMLIVLVTQMFAPTTLLIGIYREMTKLHLLNSYLGLILINTAFNLAFSIWILSSFFKTIPLEIEEAAAIDGCSRWQTFRKISLPLALPGIVTTSIFIFIAAWNEYVVAYTLAQSPTVQPFSVGLALLTGYYEVQWNYLFAGSLIAIIPVIILFSSIQKYLVSGLTAGSVK